MKTLQLSSFGAPTDVVQLAEVDSADPGPGQLVVSIEAAPINPSDLNLIRALMASARCCRRRWERKESVG